MAAKLNLSAELLAAKTQFENWRLSKSKRRRIPEGMWQVGVGLAKREGLYRVARELKLQHRGLKKRMEAPVRKVESVGGNGFWELVPPLVPESNGEPKWMIEVTRQNGEKLSVHGSHRFDLLGVILSFGSART